MRKFLWALCTLLFPEFILVHAAVERKMAITSLAEMDEALRHLKNKADMDEVLHHPKNNGWTLTHAYFANMGGVRVKPCDGLVWGLRDTPLTTKQLAEAI